MILRVDIEAAKPLLLLRNGGKRMLYGVVNAINDTAKDIQRAEQARAQSVFTLRSQTRAFLLRQVAIIKPLASVPAGRFEARVSVGERPRLLLPRFEAGGERRGFKGGRVAIPVVGGARPTQAATVPESLWVQRLQLRRHTARGRRRVRPGTKQDVRVGLEGTFQIAAGIFQRVGQAVRALYLFRPTVRLPAVLGFIATARATADRTFAAHLRKEIKDAFDFALK